MMVADGIRVVKCFLHITPAEQIRRFKERLTNPLKRWKLSYEDFRNRVKRLSRTKASARRDQGGIYAENVAAGRGASRLS